MAQQRSGPAVAAKAAPVSAEALANVADLIQDYFLPAEYGNMPPEQRERMQYAIGFVLKNPPQQEGRYEPTNSELINVLADFVRIAKDVAAAQAPKEPGSSATNDNAAWKTSTALLGVLAVAGGAFLTHARNADAAAARNAANTAATAAQKAADTIADLRQTLKTQTQTIEGYKTIAEADGITKQQLTTDLTKAQDRFATEARRVGSLTTELGTATSKNAVLQSNLTAASNAYDSLFAGFSEKERSLVVTTAELAECAAKVDYLASATANELAEFNKSLMAAGLLPPGTLGNPGVGVSGDMTSTNNEYQLTLLKRGLDELLRRWKVSKEEVVRAIGEADANSELGQIGKVITLYPRIINEAASDLPDTPERSPSVQAINTAVHSLVVYAASQTKPMVDYVNSTALYALKTANIAGRLVGKGLLKTADSVDATQFIDEAVANDAFKLAKGMAPSDKLNRFTTLTGLRDYIHHQMRYRAAAVQLFTITMPLLNELLDAVYDGTRSSMSERVLAAEILSGLSLMGVQLATTEVADHVHFAHYYNSQGDALAGFFKGNRNLYKNSTASVIAYTRAAVTPITDTEVYVEATLSAGVPVNATVEDRRLKRGGASQVTVRKVLLAIDNQQSFAQVDVLYTYRGAIFGAKRTATKPVWVEMDRSLASTIKDKLSEDPHKLSVSTAAEGSLRNQAQFDRQVGPLRVAAQNLASA